MSLLSIVAASEAEKLDKTKWCVFCGTPIGASGNLKLKSSNVLNVMWSGSIYIVSFTIEEGVHFYSPFIT